MTEQALTTFMQNVPAYRGEGERPPVAGSATSCRCGTGIRAGTPEAQRSEERAERRERIVLILNLNPEA
jgi:hypothetical protein